LVFQRNVRARDGIFRQPVDGSAEATMVLERKDRPHPCAFTPDGRGLVFMDASPGPRAEALIHTADGGLSVLRTGAQHPDGLAFWPDGRFLAFASRESGRNEVYVQPYPGRGATAVSTTGGSSPRWSPDGKELFFRSDGKLMAVDVETAPRLRLGKPRVLFER